MYDQIYTVENRKKRTNVFSDIGENTEISNACDEGREEWNEKRTGSDTHKFDFITILQATDNFSLANKIGEGGFGPVYKVISSLKVTIKLFYTYFLNPFICTFKKFSSKFKISEIGDL